MKRVQDVMTKDPACCTPSDSLQQVARMMLDYDCGAIPVVETASTMRPIGIITDRDIACRSVALGKNPLQMTAADCMTPHCATVSPEDSIEECEDIMRENQVRRVVVVDNDGKCCGIVVQAHIARYASEMELAGVLRDISQPSHTAHAKM
ncbi:MAG TPA: CBS domain-containing protein [Gammaproteobacteria bacterium]|nr:CBS domain-containing protein [Gammaproteobacteria bacterium]